MTTPHQHRYISPSNAGHEAGDPDRCACGEARPERLTVQQGAILSAYTGILVGEFNDCLEYIEKLMGRPVFTHELRSKELWAAIKERAEPDMLAIAPISDERRGLLMEGKR